MDEAHYYCLPLKELPGTQGRGPLRYLDILMLLLQSPIPGRGLTTDEVRHRAQMQRTLTMDAARATFGEKQYAFLVELAQKHIWPLATLELDTFLNDLFTCDAQAPPAESAPKGSA